MKPNLKIYQVLITLFLLNIVQCNFRIGVGIADVTGPLSDVAMLGYCKDGQNTGGLHLRLFSRAYIISNKDGSNPVVFVSVEICMMADIIKMEVANNLKAHFGSLYTGDNIMLSATHTHSGPGGYQQYVLYQFNTHGFYEPSFRAIVEGITESIVKAHDNMKEGSIYLNKGKLFDANINRSPLAYENNPKEEKSRYSYNTDKEMILLKFIGKDGNDLGMINWFPVHPVSMNNSNTLVSSDNRGYASLLFEKNMNPSAAPGEGEFVASFASSNIGDVSPNLKGPRCIDSGLPCDSLTNTCGKKVQNCIAFGPGSDMFESTKIIAERMNKKANSLYEGADIKLEGPVKYKQRFVDMTKQKVEISSGNVTNTCKPAMGFSFAAGTSDGPGQFSFKQGDKTGNKFWRFITRFIKHPSSELKQCHGTKPVLLATGEMNFPYKWQPDILDFNVFQIGQVFIVSVPGEFSTMAGRRLRNKIKATLKENGFSDSAEVIIAGLSNSYASYITTFEEYQIQRYEGASTVYGPHTHEAMVSNINDLVLAILLDTALTNGAPTPNLLKKQWSLMTAVHFDAGTIHHSIGDVILQTETSYKRGQNVKVIFQAGNARNSNQRKHCFAYVEKLLHGGSWLEIMKDGEWDTKFTWKSSSLMSPYSTATIEWHISNDTEVGVYRIRHEGHKKSFFGNKVSAYQGISKIFYVR